MNKTDNLTRDEAIALAGPVAVLAVDGANCDYTGRLMYRIKPGSVEFAAVTLLPVDNEFTSLEAVFYQSEEDVKAATELDELDWTVDHYRVS